MLPTDKQARKERPVASGVLSYFPDSIAEIAHVSFIGNRQHNGNAPMHWSRHKSTDHRDCIARHLLETGAIDTDGVRHTAKLAWRALALLQIELEEAEQVPAVPYRKQVLDELFGILPPAVNPADSECSKPFPPVSLAGYAETHPLNMFGEVRDNGSDALAEAHINLTNDHIDLHKQGHHEDGRKDLVALELVKLGCPPATAKQIVGGVSFCPGITHIPPRWAYVAGPMRGYKNFNFPAFDSARDALLAKGYHVISPADIDRNAGDGWKEGQTQGDPTPFVLRDFWSLFFLRKQGGLNAIALLPHWERSTGASAEFFLARWLGLSVLDRDADPYQGSPVQHFAMKND